MPTRLSAMDADFYRLEASDSPMHIGSLLILDRPAVGRPYERLLTLVEGRLHLVPRYRQKVQEVNVFGALPVWVDDPDFDIGYHVRRSALPQPGTPGALHDLIARLNSRALDRSRPLWEMYLIEGLERDRLAVFVKSHEALINGVGAVELLQVLMEAEPTIPDVPDHDLWMPAPVPSNAELAVSAAIELVSRPVRTAAMVRGAAVGAVKSAQGLTESFEAVAGGVLGALRQRTQAPPSKLNASTSRSRRYAVTEFDLEEFRGLRESFDATVNDLILTVISGALRTWLTTRESRELQVRALVPISVFDDADSDDDADADTGAAEGPVRVVSYLVDLPVGESNAVVRLRQLAHAARAEIDRKRQVAASRLTQQKGFSASTLHALGARASATVSRRQFNILITNAPGPQEPRYLAGNEVLEVYPVPPLVRNQVVTIGITSYNGRLYFGMNADRDTMWDLDQLTEYLRESLSELTDAAR